MRIAFQFYRLLNHLSIDVAAGAMIGALFFSSIFHSVITGFDLGALGLTVWIIYTLDHLQDAHKIKERASTARHRFHQDHPRLLIFMVVLATFLDILFLFFIRASVVQLGMALVILVGFYFLAQQNLFFLKEILAAVLYTAGVALPAYAGTNVSPSLPSILAILLFLNTALLNLVIFSWFDRRQDLRHQQPSLVILKGEQKARKIILVLFLMGGLLVIFFQIISQQWVPTLIFLSMNSVLLLIFNVQGYFGLCDRYRLVGDAIFFLPAFYLMT